MSMKIENRRQLRAEIVRLQIKLTELKAVLKDDVEEIKEELNFYRIIAELISKMAKVRISRDLFTAEGFISELKSILKQVLIRRGTGFFAKRLFSSFFQIFAWARSRKRKK